MDDTPQGPPPTPPDVPPPAPPADPPPAAPPPAEASGGPPPSDQVNLGRYLSEGWQLFVENPALMLGAFAIVFVLLLVSAITVIGPLLLVGPLMAGYYAIVDRLRSGQDAEFGDLFGGFSDFGRTCVAGLLVVLVFILGAVVELVIGFVLSYIPCLGTIVALVVNIGISIVTAAVTMFIIPAVALTSKTAVEALNDNVGFAQNYVAPAMLLALVHLGLSLLGTAVCIVGLLIAMPVAAGFTVAAYRDYVMPRL
jgi:uncharacterized membrane protein